MTERETYHHGTLRQALVSAALELISEKDVESVSLREVARRVGVSHAAPYRHFVDKEALLAAIAEEGFQRLRQALEERMDPGLSDPLKQLQMLGVTYVDFALEHASHYRLMFGAYGATSTQQNPELAEAAAQAFRVLVDAIAQGQQAGVIRAEDPKQLALAAWAMVHGLAMLFMDGQIPIAPAQPVVQVSTLITQLLVEGLANYSSRLVNRSVHS